LFYALCCISCVFSQSITGTSTFSPDEVPEVSTDPFLTITATRPFPGISFDSNGFSSTGPLIWTNNTDGSTFVVNKYDITIPIGSYSFTARYQLGSFAKQFEVSGSAQNITFTLVYPGKQYAQLTSVPPVTKTSNCSAFSKSMMIGLRMGGTYASKLQNAEKLGCSATMLVFCSPGYPDYCPAGRTYMNSRATTTGTAGTVYKTPISMISFSDGQPIINAFEYFQSWNMTDFKVEVTVPGTGPLTDLQEFQALKDVGNLFIPFEMRMQNTWQLNDYVTGAIVFGTTPNETAIPPIVNPCIGTRMQGIFCVGGHVYRIKYSRNKVTGSFNTSTFKNLRWLETFDAYANSISGEMPDLTGMNKLINFQIFDNKITTIHSSLSSLKQLQILIMSNNPFITTSLPDLTSLTNLQTLICSRCGLTEYPTLPLSVQFVDLSINKFSTALTSNIVNSSYINLQTFDIGFNKFTANLTAAAFDNFPQLARISLKGNVLYGVLPYFNNCPKIQSIEIGDNMLTGDIPLTYNTPSLKSLNISNNLLYGPFDLRKSSLVNFYASNNKMNPFVDTKANNPYLVKNWQDYISGTSWSTFFYLFPSTIQNINLAYNRIGYTYNKNLQRDVECNSAEYATKCGDFISMLFPGSLNAVLKLEFQGNKIGPSLPADLWGTVTTIINYIDLSNNKLFNPITPGTPPATMVTLKMDNNPFMYGPDLPDWIVPSNTLTSINDFICPNLVGSTNPLLTLSIDPSYYKYKGCICGRGLWGNPPNCQNIPSIVQMSDLSFNDGSFAVGTVLSSTRNLDRVVRYMAGSDISWVLAFDQAVKTINIQITKTSEFETLPTNSTFANKVTISSTCPAGYSFNYATSSCSCKQGTLFNVETNECTQNNKDTSSVLQQSYSLISADGSPRDNRYTILNRFATVNFRSQKTSGVHFSANYTISYECPEGFDYFEQYDGNYLIHARCLMLFKNSQGIAYAVYAISAAFSSLLLFVTTVVVKKRNTLIIKSSSFPFCFCMLVFMTILCIGGVFYAISPEESSAVCHLRAWVTGLPLVFILSALLVKADRIRKIFTSKELVVQAISNTQLAKVMTVMVGGEFAILLWFSGGQISTAQLEIGTGSTANALVHSCTEASSSWIGIQFAYIAFFLFAGVLEAWGVRKVPSAFNEGPHIASTLLSLTVLLVILIPVQFMVSDNPDALMVIRGVGQVLVSTVMTFFLFGPKLYFILEGKENDKTLTSVGSSKSSSSSSSMSSNVQSKSAISVDSVAYLIKKISNSVADIKAGSVDFSAIENAFIDLKKSNASIDTNTIATEISNMKEIFNSQRLNEDTS